MQKYKNKNYYFGNSFTSMEKILFQLTTVTDEN